MKARDVMTAGAAIVSPDTTILEAAKTMAESDVGILLVGKGDRLVGMITDRDIAIRGVAGQGRRGNEGRRADDRESSLLL